MHIRLNTYTTKYIYHLNDTFDTILIRLKLYHPGRLSKACKMTVGILFKPITSLIIELVSFPRLLVRT